jgi:hypothetical protein
VEILKQTKAEKQQQVKSKSPQKRTQDIAPPSSSKKEPAKITNDESINNRDRRMSAEPVLVMRLMDPVQQSSGKKPAIYVRPRQASLENI